MNRHRDDLALVRDSVDLRRDSHVRARQPGLAEDLERVIVRPTITVHDRRYERRVEAAANALAQQAATLHALLAEPLTRPLGSMQTPQLCTGEEGITLVQSQKRAPGPSANAQHALRQRREHAHARLAALEPNTDTQQRMQQIREQTHARLASLEPNADTYHGLREIREHAHARLASLEAAAAVSVKPSTHAARSHRPTQRVASTELDSQARTAAAKRSRVARSRDDQQRSATAQPTSSAEGEDPNRPDHRPAPRTRSCGLTDARNALRRAYATSKLRAPSAPPARSAKSAGIVDGWERLPGAKPPKRPHRHARTLWLCTVLLALSSMLTAFALTLSLVPAGDPEPTRPGPAAIVYGNLPMPPEAPTDPTPPAAPAQHKRPRLAVAPKAQKAPTPVPVRAECRDHPLQSK